MRPSDRKLQKRLEADLNLSPQREGLPEAIRRAKTAFFDQESEIFLSRAEFLYQQSRYIRKHWWVLQGILLLLLWYLLDLTQSSLLIRKGMGAAAPLFAVLLLPELWKNRSFGALEIECAAYYSLRQIYAARIFLFALVDLCLLCIFSSAAVLSGKIGIEELIVQFFLPYLVTCCICFGTLYSAKAGSQAFSLLLCMIWCFFWTQVVLIDQIYYAVSLPIWLAMAAAAVLCLGFCIFRGQRDCCSLWEVTPL